MSLPAAILPGPLQWLVHAIFALILLQSLRHAPWDYLKNREDNNILFASAILLWLFWQFRAVLPANPGLEFHLLLATTVTLMFGWAFAFLVVCAAQLLATIQGHAEWASFTANALCNGAVPIATTVAIYYATRRWLPQHFFIYIFICCFLAGALAMLASRASGMAALLTDPSYTVSRLETGGYLAMLPITMFAEAFINGAIMTMLVVFKPHWVGSFRDQHYLKGK